MIETSDLYYGETFEVLNSVQPYHNEQGTNSQQGTGRKPWIGRVLRFGLVGGLNTIIDLLILNMLLLVFPTSSIRMVLVYSAIAYSLGVVNSFLLNKYWTFGYRQRTTWRAVARFIVTTLFGIGWSSMILWLASNALHPLLINTTVWVNASKVIAISGTALISYLGMSLWVFVNKARKEQTRNIAHVPAWGDASILTQPTPTRFNVSELTRGDASVLTQPYTRPAPTRCGIKEVMSEEQRLNTSSRYEQSGAIEFENEPSGSHSISVVLPALNEEQVIASTVSTVLEVLNAWSMDFEIIVVNDGSTDRTREIVEAIVDAHPRIRLVTHTINEGYGASLISGFTAATKELVFFMDSDGQFDIRDLQEFFPLIDTYDAVIGYRIDRQDSWMRKLNAWGWKQLIGWVLGVHARDVDCAFKLLHTEFLHQHPLETRGAMINAELLYRLKRAGCSYKEVGVIHLPRLYGSATGARPGVILRAFRELFVSTRRWRREEKMLTMQHTKSGLRMGSGF